MFAINEHPSLLLGGELIDSRAVCHFSLVAAWLTSSRGSSRSRRNVRVCGRHLVSKGNRKGRRNGRWTRPHVMGCIRGQELRASENNGVEKTKGTGCCDYDCIAKGGRNDKSND